MKTTSWAAGIAAIGAGACMEMDLVDDESTTEQELIIDDEDWDDIANHINDPAYWQAYHFSKGIADVNGSSCTAALIGRDLILFAAHCRRDANGNAVVNSVTARFGRERNLTTGVIPAGDSYTCPTMMTENKRFDLVIYRCNANAAGDFPGDKHTIVPLSRTAPAVGDEMFTITDNCRTTDCGTVGIRLLFSPGGTAQTNTRFDKCDVGDDDDLWTVGPNWPSSRQWDTEGFETNCDVLPGSSGGPVLYRTKDVGIAGVWSRQYSDPLTEHNDAGAVWKYTRNTDGDGDRILDFAEYQVFTGDVDGDNRTDLIKIETGNSAAVRVYLGTATGFAAPATWATWVLPADVHFVVADFDGDGLDDIAKVDNGSPGGIWVGTSNGVNAFNGSQWGTWDMSPSMKLVAGYFSNDGRADLVRFVPGTPGQVFLGRSRTVGGVNSFASTLWASWWWDLSTQVLVGDFDNNGQDDIMKFDNGAPGGVYVGLAQTIGTLVTTKWDDWFMDPWTRVLAGDFNADGRTDVMKLDNGQPGGVWVGLSNGSAFTTTKWADWFMSPDTQVIAGRFAGLDLRWDILKVDNQSQDAALNMWIGRSTGSSFVGSNEGAYWIQPQLTLLAADHNGDIRHDAVIFGHGAAGAGKITIRTTP
jgi:V8-like Glu-specific endopeptidase